MTVQDVVLKSFEDDIKEILEREKPDVIGLQICRKRRDALLHRRKWENTRLTKELLSGQSLGTLFSQLLYINSLDEMGRDSQYTRSIKAAVRYAAENRIPVVYLDRDIDLTIKRAWYSLHGRKKLAFVRFVRRRLLGFGVHDTNDGKMMPMDHLTESISGFAPDARKILVDERIEYTSRKIKRQAQARKMVALVAENELGAIKKRLESPKLTAKTSELETLKIKPWKPYVKFVIPIAFFSFVMYWLANMELAQVKEALLLWAFVVMVLCGAGAALARGHPWSILTAIVLAPVFSWMLIGSGWIAGIVELKVRSPNIRDLKSLGRMKSYSDVFNNRCFRPLLVGGFANIGNLIAISYLVPIIVRMGAA